MFLILYPIDNNKKYERHSFDWVTSKKEDAIKALKQLHEIADALFYNISTTSYSSFFQNLDEFVNDCNDEQIDLNNYWCVYLDVTEKEALEALN